MTAPAAASSGPSGDSATPAIELRGIRKRYPGVVALDGVSFDVRYGEIHALLGENGAGKSTLIKVITGTTEPDDGTIAIAGRELALPNPRAAREQGISYVPQDVLVVPQLSIGRNMLLGVEPVRTPRGRLTADERRVTRAALDRMGAGFDERTPAHLLSVPELRLAQVARALLAPGDIIVLDEPTAALSESDAEHLLERLVALRGEGKAIVYVTHRLGEVTRIADRVTVLRDGRDVGAFARHELSRDAVLAVMTKDAGHDAPITATRPRSSGDAPPLLQVRGLSSPGHFDGVDLDVAEGQIVGIAGVQGSGHGRLLRTLAGLDAPSAGEITVAGNPLRPGSVPLAFAHGLALVPGDRRGAGIVASMSVRDNIALSPAGPREMQRVGWRRRSAERAVASGYVRELSIRTSTLETRVGTLSGGNQQKVVLARALEASPSVLLVEEPTQGVDVNAKVEIRTLLERSARRPGCSAVLGTSDFEELTGLADVVYVMRLGRVTARLEGDRITYREILSAAL